LIYKLGDWLCNCHLSISRSTLIGKRFSFLWILICLVSIVIDRIPLTLLLTRPMRGSQGLLSELFHIPLLNIYLCKKNGYLVLDKVKLQLRMSLIVSNVYMYFNEFYKLMGMLVRNLYIESFIDLFIFNVISIVSISFIFSNHIMHYYTRFYNEKWVGGRLGYVNIILFWFWFFSIFY